MTSGRALRLSSAAAACAVLAGCGSGGADEYANLNRQSAEQQALTAVVRSVTDPASIVYHHRVRLVSATKSHAPDGREAWKVVILDRTAKLRLCVYTRLGTAMIGTAPTTDVVVCGGS